MNMKKITILLALCLAGASVMLSGCSKSKSSSGPPADLKIKWQAGRQYDMAMNLNQVSDINVPGQPMHQELKLVQGLQYSPVKDLDNGGHEVKLEFSRQNMSFTQNGKELVSYDSDDTTPMATNSPTAAIGAVMRAMLGVPLVYTIGADGKVEKIDGVDSLMSRIDAAMPDQRQRMQLDQLYDQDTLKRYGSLAESLPDHPVSIGDTWTSSIDINNQTGVMTVDSTYTFKDWVQHSGHKCAHFAITGDIKTKTATAAATGAVVKVKKGVISGDAWFDPDLGVFVDIDSDQDLTLDIATRNMTLTDRMKENVKMSLVDVSP
jgi:hypothetical protein